MASGWPTTPSPCACLPADRKDGTPFWNLLTSAWPASRLERQGCMGPAARWHLAAVLGAQCWHTRNAVLPSLAEHLPACCSLATAAVLQ